MTFIAILLFVFLVLGICQQVYFYRKISGAVMYFGSNLSKWKRILLMAGIFLLTFIPIPFSFIKWYIIEAHIAVFLLLSDLAVIISKKVGRKKEIKYPRWLKNVYRTGAVAILLTFAVVLYGKYNMYHVIRTEYDLTLNKHLSRNYKIALVADVHYGTTLDAEQLQAVAEAIEKESPDLIILCGDIVDESTPVEMINEPFSILGDIDTKLGIYYVYGNHDKSNYRRIDKAAGETYNLQLADAITSNRIDILDDNAVLINDEMLLVGRKDKSLRAENGKTIDEILTDKDKSLAILVADHQPCEYDELNKAGCDIVVSGHTHAGQVFPFGLFIDLVKVNDMTYGYKKIGNLNAIVTSGTAGWGFDMRTESHSEYVMINIKGKD